jgi:hypothetical protein
MNKRNYTTDSTETTKKKREPLSTRLLPTKAGWISAIPIGILVLYVTLVAPGIIPVPRSVKVPFPEATRFLEWVCQWCGQHPWHVLGIGASLLLPGILFRFVANRYYIWLTVLMMLTLGFVYISISAPIDRLFNGVEAKLDGYDREYGYEKRY